MYKTLKSAKEAAKKFVGKYPFPPVITENKPVKNARCTFYNFRFLVNEPFNPNWVKDRYGHYHRMIEVLN
jgi:hypothetical protein